MNDLSLLLVPGVLGLAWLGSRGPDRSFRTLGPTVSGTWYPANAASLGAQVDELLRKAPEPAGDLGDVIAVIAPHAGYQYSGEVAAHGFRAVQGARPLRVIVIGPSHYVGFRGAAVPDADEYRTPLGSVPLDLCALDSVRAKPGFTTNNAAFRQEHSLEAEIPFLQRALATDFKLVPVLIGGGSTGAVAEQIAHGLEPLVGSGCLVVVSSDFTHFGHDFGYVPFRQEVPQRLRGLDLGAVELIEKGDAVGFDGYLDRTGATVCGRDAIAVLLRLLPGGTRASLVAYDTSGRMTGEWDHTVSYAAIVFRAASQVRP